MPLRRITFSGRLLLNSSGENIEDTEAVWRTVLKGFAAVALDIVIALGIAVAAFLIFMGVMVAPYERGFYCYQIAEFNLPFVPNTVSTTHLLICTLASPFFVILLAEAIFFRAAKGHNRLRKYFSSATYTYLEYLATFTLATFLMEAFKCAFARLRPHYFAVCKPDWSKIDCSNENNYIEDAHCLGTDAHRIRVGRQSFPSGHTAAAVHLVTFLYFYLTGMVNASNIPLLRSLRLVTLLLAVLWTLTVMVTRVTDNWHHPADVLGGVLLGFSCVYLPKLRQGPISVYQRRLLENPHSL
ncbi:hypothetical protein AB6A40_007215 [Gnathostoma spinigerum]|uniref:Phosphatidic acid phosphatase type 2/haloperoxidase domain-containing protein n=1 Tax=Gnathostoma spinigerum TaxID=75299 RepID=A0ABD6EMK3_9BILA